MGFLVFEMLNNVLSFRHQTQSTDRADQDAQRTADAMDGAWKPGETHAHLQAIRRAHPGTVAAAGAQRFIHDGQRKIDNRCFHITTPYSLVPILSGRNERTNSGSNSNGCGGNRTKQAPRSQARPARPG